MTIVRSGEVLTIYPTRKPIGELVKQLQELPRPSEIEVRDDEVLRTPLKSVFVGRGSMQCWRRCQSSRSMMLLPMRIGRSSKRSGIRQRAFGTFRALRCCRGSLRP